MWATSMPGPSNSQPALGDDRLFVCAEPFLLLCVRLSDGKELWRRSNSYRDLTGETEWTKITRELERAKPLRDRMKTIDDRLKELRRRDSDDSSTDEAIEKAEKEREELTAKLEQLPLAARYTLPITQKQYNGYTTATPTTDGKHVWAVFGNRVVVCYDVDGKRRWSVVLPDNPHMMWGHSSSPLLVSGKLVVCIDDIVALDAKTGDTLWRTRHGQAWGSPVRATIGGEDVVFMSNGRVLRAADGKLIARGAAPLERASPVVHDGIVYYLGLGGTALELPDKVSEKLELKERWTADTKGGLYTASPVVHEGLAYACSSRQILNVLDAATGETIYVKRLSLGREPVWPSLCVAGNYLYVSSRDGTTLVLKTGRTYEEVARNELEFFISSPIFRGSRMYLRTREHLYCIGEGH